MNIHACTQPVLSWEQQIQAARIAVQERASNGFLNSLATADATKAPEGADVLSAVLLTDKKWPVGRKITIGFLDGSKALQAKVKAVANEWMEIVNLVFVWVEDGGTADIRITFTRGGSWSYLGTDNLTIRKPNPTMQYGWLTETSNQDEINRVVRHEFGHMLALGHEQAHPKGAIPWNKPVVYDYYRRTNGWDKAQVDSQVFKLYAADQTNFSAYDKLSIMHYSIPAELLLDASRAVPWNTNFSATDITHMRNMYPKATVPEKPTEKTLWSTLVDAGFKPRMVGSQVKVVAKQFDSKQTRLLADIADAKAKGFAMRSATATANAAAFFEVG